MPANDNKKPADKRIILSVQKKKKIIKTSKASLYGLELGDL